MGVVRAFLRFIGFFLIGLSIGAIFSLSIAAEGERRAIEGYPDIIADRLQQRALEIAKLPDQTGAASPKFIVVKDARRWVPGSTVTVAFEGGSGDTTLRKTVEEAARVWTQYANLKFDFHDPKTSAYREFTTNDNQYVGDIRISFRTGGVWEGYWWAIGNDSKTDRFYKPWEPSINLGGIEREKYEELVAIVLHEFGHALGAEHEHQHPGSGCNDEWRWDDDAGYVSTTDAEGILDMGQLQSSTRHLFNDGRRSELLVALESRRQYAPAEGSERVRYWTVR